MRWVIVALFALVSIDASAADPKTERLWRAKCGSCHGEDGKAQTEQGKKMGVADLTTAAWQKQFTDDKIKAAIADGVNETRDGKKKEMDAFKSKLRPEQIADLTAFIRSLGK
jgi:mono/diheme cytochrome c family protein